MFHRLLGIAAAVGQRLSRVSINLLPLHWVAMFLLGVLATVGSKSARDALVNDTTPRVVTIAEVLDHVDTTRNYVAVQGRLFHEPVFRKTHRSGGVEASFLAFLDPTGRRALLVRYAGTPPSGTEMRDTTITGMLVTLENGVRRELERTGGKIGDVPFDLDYMLEVGAKPGSAVVWGVLAAVATLLLLAMFLTWRWKYVVFRATSAAAMAPTANLPEGGIGLFVSGRLQMGAHRRHFVGMPAMVGRDDGGRLVVLSRIDASTRFFGIKTADRTGVWSAVLDGARLQEMQLGEQFLGLQRWPALRVGTSDGVAVLGCATAAERDHLWQELPRLARPA